VGAGAAMSRVDGEAAEFGGVGGEGHSQLISWKTGRSAEINYLTPTIPDDHFLPNRWVRR
jgi:hypothetical protein